jgi:PIN domain nuclease of toxin-antitoxin system
VKLLLDTHALLWFQAGDRRLSPTARRRMEEADALVISAASVWEMAIKASRGRLTLPVPVDVYVRELTGQGYESLPVSAAHAAAVEGLEWHHDDPFDRLLAAQALVEHLAIVSRDRVLRRYGVDVVW